VTFDFFRGRSSSIYKHCRKQISAVILKPNSNIISQIRYIYECFLSYDSSRRAYIYAQICDLHKEVLYVVLRIFTIHSHFPGQHQLSQNLDI